MITAYFLSIFCFAFRVFAIDTATDHFINPGIGPGQQFKQGSILVVTFETTFENPYLSLYCSNINNRKAFPIPLITLQIFPCTTLSISLADMWQRSSTKRSTLQPSASSILNLTTPPNPIATCKFKKARGHPPRRRPSAPVSSRLRKMSLGRATQNPRTAAAVKHIAPPLPVHSANARLLLSRGGDWESLLGRRPWLIFAVDVAATRGF